tara:strand:- start:1533 stop:1898 length:366 start_codon:yes stop_codon:yes gene_type:complete
MTKCDIEKANLRQGKVSAQDLLNHLKKINLKKATDKPTVSHANIRQSDISKTLNDTLKHMNAYYVVAKDKSQKHGYVETQTHKKLTKASSSMSRDAWKDLALRVGNMTYKEKQEWIKHAEY